MMTNMIIRIKREECKRTKHDTHFSNWKILVGESDWSDYLVGKEGADRYRVHNLPSTSGPGVYELGIVVSCKVKLESDNVVVVYLGQADNVRTRLQRYGRSGAHLNNPIDGSGSGCFDDVFSRGYSLVYRWAPMKNKVDALKTENELLNTFDYAWNKESNGTRRHYDVLQKLNSIASNNIQLPNTVRKLLYYSQKSVGIKIEARELPSLENKPSTNGDEEGLGFFSRIFKFTKSQPRLVLERLGTDENHTGICGVSLDDDSVCRRPPVEGRKRCTHHKGWRIRRSNPVKPSVVEEKCEVGEEDKLRRTNESDYKLIETSGSMQDVVFYPCASSFSDSLEMSGPGRLNPQVSSKRLTNKPQICGVELDDGTVCINQPVKGRVRCGEHKSLKIKGIKSKSAEVDKSNAYDAGSNLNTLDERDYCSSVCGAPTRTGFNCKRTVKGGGRCWQHQSK